MRASRTHTHTSTRPFPPVRTTYARFRFQDNSSLFQEVLILEEFTRKRRLCDVEGGGAW